MAAKKKPAKPVKNWQPNEYRSAEARSAAYRAAREAGAIPLSEKYKANVKQI